MTCLLVNLKLIFETIFNGLHPSTFSGVLVFVLLVTVCYLDVDYMANELSKEQIRGFINNKI